MEKFLTPSQAKLYRVADLLNTIFHVVVFLLFFLIGLSTDLIISDYYSLVESFIMFGIWLIVVGVALYASYVFMSVKIETFKNTSIIASSKSSEESPKIDFHTTLMSED